MNLNYSRSRRVATVAVGVFLVTLLFVYHATFWLDTGESFYDEMVDVSESGEVGMTGISINLAHINGIHHRGVWIFLLNSCASHILFVRRSNATVVCTNSWNTFGEHAQVKESFRQAALRGLKEELSLTKKDFIMFKRIDIAGSRELLTMNHNKINRSNKEWKQTYVGVLQNDNIFSLDQREALSSQWIDISTAAEWISYCGYTGGSTEKICRTCMDASNITLTTTTTTTINIMENLNGRNNIHNNNTLSVPMNVNMTSMSKSYESPMLLRDHRAVATRRKVEKKRQQQEEVSVVQRPMKHYGTDYGEMIADKIASLVLFIQREQNQQQRYFNASNHCKVLS